jgi:hypothetical protein
MPDPTRSSHHRPDNGETDEGAHADDAVQGDDAMQGSVLLTGQVCSREQRRGRYTPESIAHPGKMLPAIPRYLINTFTQPGEWVCDPMAGIHTTIVEAMLLGRHGIGVEYEPRWARLAEANLRHAELLGATGTGHIIHGDARHLPDLIPAALHGQISLVITSPPYGPSVHGHVRPRGAQGGKVAKWNRHYGDDRANLAYQRPEALADGFTQILTGVAQILRPGGIVAVTARSYRDRDELVDIPGMVAAAGINAGLHLHEETAALIAGIRDGRLIARGSFFQIVNARNAITRGEPQFLQQHEDLIILRTPAGRSRPAGRGTGGRLDHRTSQGVDRRPPARPGTTGPGGATVDPHPGRGGESERTPNPCPPNPPHPDQPTPPGVTGPRPLTDPAPADPHAAPGLAVRP